MMSWSSLHAKLELVREEISWWEVAVVLAGLCL